MPIISAKWTRLASSARLQRSSHCVSVLGPHLWIFGGELLPRQPIDNQLDLVQLDSAQDAAATIETLPAPPEAPTPRVGSTTTVLKDALYLFSGRGGLAMAPVEENGALWRYSPAQSTWKLIKPADASAPYPAGRSYHATTSDGWSKIYIHAGCPENGRLSDLWSFDIELEAWTELPSAPSPARGGASIAVSGGKLYRMNGFDGQNEQGGAIDVYDLEGRTWSVNSFQSDGINGPGPRSVGALLAVEVGGRDLLLTLFGERDPSSLGHAGAGKMLPDVWAFDIGQGAWSKVESKGGEVPTARGWFDADVIHALSGGPGIVVHGGLAEDNSRLGDVWKLQLE